MSETTRRELKAEAIRALEGYLATGLAGLRRKGLDRVRALGIDPDRCCGAPEEIRHLVNHVNLYA